MAKVKRVKKGFKRRKSFEEWNDEMYKRHADENRYKHPNFFIRYNSLKRSKNIIALLNSKKSDEILDLGCGCGYVMKEIKDYKYLLGVDISDTALKEARTFLKEKLKNKDKVRLMKGDVQKLNLNKKFDKIISAEVIEHVPNPGELINSIVRHSKKSTNIIITVPNEDAINFIFKIFKFLKIHKIFKGVTIKMDWHLHEFNLRKFKELVKDRLDIVKVKRNPFWFFALSYVVKCRIK